MSEEQTPVGPGNVEAMTPQQASHYLENAHPDWTAAVLAGNGPQVKEFQNLVAKRASAGDKIDQVIAGTWEPPQQFGLNVAGVSDRNLMATAKDLKELGISDAAIRELLENKSFSKETLQQVEQLRRERFSDATWVDALLKEGNVECIRELILMGIIRVNGAKQEAA